MLSQSTIADLEGEADLLLRLTHQDPEQPPDLRAICVALTGHAPELAAIRREGETVLVNGERRIFIRRGLPRARARWVLGHEIGHVVHARDGYVGEDLEARCNALGAALAVPRGAYLRALRSVGEDLHALADALDTTQSIALLRDGEVRGRPVSVVRAVGAIVRGDETFAWPRVLELRKAERTRHRAVAKARIKDEPARVGLRGKVAA